MACFMVLLKIKRNIEKKHLRYKIKGLNKQNDRK